MALPVKLIYAINPKPDVQASQSMDRSIFWTICEDELLHFRTPRGKRTPSIVKALVGETFRIQLAYSSNYGLGMVSARF